MMIWKEMINVTKLTNNRGTWGAVAAAAISVGAGAASSAIKNSSAKDGEMGYDMPMLTNAPWDATNQQLSSQMAQQSALNAQQGRLDPGMEILLENIRKQQLQQSKEQMFGRAGQRGGSIMGAVDSRSSRSGVGPKAFMAQGSKALQDYAGRNSQIMNYIDSLKFSGLQKQGQQAFNQMQKMPRSNEIPYTGHVVKMNTPAQPGMDTGLQNVDWSKIVDNTGWFDKKAPADVVDVQYNMQPNPTQNEVIAQQSLLPQYR